MPGKNKTPLVGWHPPADLQEWIRAEITRRDMRLSAFLNAVIRDAMTAQTAPVSRLAIPGRRGAV